MRLFFVITSAFDPNAGGVQRTTWKLGKYFTEQDLDVYYYSFSLGGHKECSFGRLITSQKEGFDQNHENVAHMVDELNRVKPNVVINQMPYSNSIRNALYLSKDDIRYYLIGCLRNSLFNFKDNIRERIHQLLPKRYIFLVDNIVGRKIILLRHWFQHRRALKEIINAHDKFILLAPPNFDELKYFVGKYKEHKVITIPNSIPFVSAALPVKTKTILHVGRLNIQQKRSDLLIELWEKVFNDLPDWNFVIVGDGPYYSVLRNEIERRSLPRIYLEGFQKPEIYYQKAAIFVMPSAYEGFPNTLIEAQSFGCVPLVFNSYKSVSWILNDGNDSYLIKPYDLDGMAEKLISLCVDNDQLLVLGANSLLNARRFTIDNIGKIWLEFFREIGQRW